MFFWTGSSTLKGCLASHCCADLPHQAFRAAWTVPFVGLGAFSMGKPVADLCCLFLSLKQWLVLCKVRLLTIWLAGIHLHRLIFGSGSFEVDQSHIVVKVPARFLRWIKYSWAVYFDFKRTISCLFLKAWLMWHMQDVTGKATSKNLTGNNWLLRDKKSCSEGLQLSKG